MIAKTLVFKAPYPHNRTIVWDVSSKWTRDRAYVDLFRILDSELGMYTQADTVTGALLDLARAGNPEACEALLCFRRNRTGEQFEEIEVRSPVVDGHIPLDMQKLEERTRVQVDCPEALAEVGLPPMPWPSDGELLKRPRLQKSEE